MDFYTYLINEINTLENAYSSNLYQNPIIINKKYDEEICSYTNDSIMSWNASQKSTLVKILLENALWKTLERIIPEMNYRHNWGYTTKKKNILKFINILKTSSRWQPLPYYVVIMLLQENGTARDFSFPIFDEAKIETITQLIKYNFYIRECNSYLDHISCE
jgi:hypothetical protein